MQTATIDTLHAQLSAIAALADAAEPRPTSQALEAIGLLATEALNLIQKLEDDDVVDGGNSGTQRERSGELALRGG